MKKGFTLVEIMASIIILSVVMMIGVGVYNQVNDKIRQKQYENKIIYIENQAALYGSETGFIETTVQQLVDEGYVEADEGKRVTDPRHPKDPKYDLNPYVVEIRREGENYYGQLINVTVEKDSDGNYIYNTDSLDQTNKNLNIIVKIQNSNIILEENDWTNKNVTLSYEIKGDKKGENPTSVTWFDNVNSFQGIKEDSIEVSASQYLNTEYRVEVIFSDGTKYEAKRTVKIDKQAPVVYEKSIKIEKEDEWTNSDKKVTILASDQNGSGIAGYAVVELDNYTKCKDLETNQWINPNGENPEVYETSLGAGTHYICVKDQAGNYNDDNIDISQEDPPLPQVVVDKIDTTAPGCKIVASGKTAGEKGLPCAAGYCDWYVENVSFKVESWDNKNSDGTTISEGDYSGVLSVVSPKNLTEDGLDQKVTATVIDKAGNVGTCESGTVNIDTSPPTCGFTNEAQTENPWSKNRTVSIYCKGDTGSGCQNKIEGLSSKTYDSGTINTISNPFTSTYVYDNVGHSASCAYENNLLKQNIRVLIDNDAPACPLPKLLEWTNDEKRTVSIPCLNDHYNDNNVEGSGCASTSFSKEFENGEGKVRDRGTIDIKDKVGNSRTCDVPVHMDREAPKCVTPLGDENKKGYVINDKLLQAVGWTNTEKNVYIDCNDKETITRVTSGCSNTSFSKKFSSGTTGTITIKDNAGNTTECPVDVKIDKTSPTVSCEGYVGSGDEAHCLKCTYKDNNGGTLNVLTNFGTEGWHSVSDGNTESYCQPETHTNGFDIYIMGLCDSVGNCMENQINYYTFGDWDKLGYGPVCKALKYKTPPDDNNKCVTHPPDDKFKYLTWKY